MVEAVVARIEQEDRMVAAARQARQEAIQEAMRQSVADRQLHQATARAQEAAEERRSGLCRPCHIPVKPS